jgi:hypothetical protein
MAIRSIPTNDKMTDDDLIAAALSAEVDKRSIMEIVDAFDALHLWKDHFGELVELAHCDGGDDPPDVITVFADGTRISFEHTGIDPQHRKHAEAVRTNGDPGHKLVTNVLPISRPTHDRKEIVQQIFTPPGAALWENVSDASACWEKNIVASILTKNRKLPSGGVLLMKTTECFLTPSFKGAVEAAFNSARSSTYLEKWVFLLLARWNSVSWFSARNTTAGTEWRSSH